MNSFKLFVILFFISLLQIFSQVWKPPGVYNRPKTETFTLDLGVNKFNKDAYLYLNPGLNMNFSGK